MNNQLAQIGDVVTVTIPKESRDWGYNPCPDGTKAKILRFGEICYGRTGNGGLKPGVYVNRAWANLQFEDGKEHYELVTRLELVDQREYTRRVDRLRLQSVSVGPCGEFLRDLPRALFWEGDFVRVRNYVPPFHLKNKVATRCPGALQVIRIDYDRLPDRVAGERQYKAYSVSDHFDAGWQGSASEDQMELVERGQVWKYFHNEPITFADLEEEVRFFERIGHTEEVCNPASQLFSWTLDEALAAIKAGTAHYYSVPNDLLGCVASYRAKRFRNEDLGRRVAEMAINGFEFGG